MGVTKPEKKQTIYTNPSDIEQSNIKTSNKPNGITNTILNKNHVIEDASLNNIGEFYRDTNIFITGATGFVGKALLEKLLRSCYLLNNVYILVRPKRGLGSEQRLKELLKNPVRTIFELNLTLTNHNLNHHLFK